MAPHHLFYRAVIAAAAAVVIAAAAAVVVVAATGSDGHDGQRVQARTVTGCTRTGQNTQFVLLGFRLIKRDKIGAS